MSILEGVIAGTSNPPREIVREAVKGIFAYAIASAFLLKNKHDSLVPSRILRIIPSMRSDMAAFKHHEQTSGTIDKIIVKCNLSEDALRLLQSDLFTRSGPLIKVVRDIYRFIKNDADFNSLVSEISNNGEQNEIIIDADHIDLSNPMTISILVDNQWVHAFRNYGLSYAHTPRIGGIGNSSLLSDYGYEVHRSFIKDILKIDIGPDSGIYYDIAHNNDSPSPESIEAATRYIYQETTNKINQRLNGSHDDMFSNYKEILLSNLIKKGYGVDPYDVDYQCIFINNDSMHQFNPNEILRTCVNNKELHAVCPSHLNPSIKIQDDIGNVVFKIRMKKEKYGKIITGHRYKVYFEPNLL